MAQYRLAMIKITRSSLLLFFIAVIPLLLWIIEVGLGSLTLSFPIFIASLGKAVALSGLALYLVNPILSMRSGWLETLFGGLDKLYTAHKSNGKVTFYLILLHPIALGAGRLLGPLGFTTIWDWWSLLVITGVFSLVALVVLTGLAIYSHIRHQKWVRVHKYFGWLIPLFMVHGFLADGVILQSTALLLFYIILSTAGFTAFLYRSVFSKYFVKQHRYEVAEVNKHTEGVVEVVLKPKSVPMSFQPGQFAFVSFRQSGIDPEFHPYSFSNAPNGPYVRFTVKALGDDTSQLKELAKGTPTYLEGPYGKFNYQNVKNNKQVWIAGGVGITPFLSMARSFSGKSNYDIRFFYGTETLDEAVFLQEFIDIMRHIPQSFQTKVVAKNLSGFISIDLLKSSLENLKEFDYMICGPPGMMKAISGQLSQAGVPIGQIHYETFSM